MLLLLLLLMMTETIDRFTTREFLMPFPFMFNSNSSSNNRSDFVACE